MNHVAGIRGRVLHALGADSFGQILNVCTRLVLTPLFLMAWGGDAYGEWLILTAIAGWVYLTDLGGQLYFVNRLTEEWSISNHQEFQAILSTGLLLFLSTSIIALFGIFIGIKFLSITTLFELKIVDENDARVILMLMVVRFVIAFPVGLYLGVYRAIGHQARSVMFGNAMVFIQFMASAVALFYDFGMLMLASIEILPFILIFFAIHIDLNRLLPKNIKIYALGKAKFLILKKAASPSLHFFVLQLSQILIIQGSMLVIANTLGPLQVAIYSSMRVIANVMSRFLGVLSHSVWPEITKLVKVGLEQKLLVLFQMVQYLALILGFTYIYIIVIFGDTLYEKWLHNGLPYNFWVMYLLSCQVVLNMIWTWGGNILMATNRHEEYSRWQIPVNLLSIFACYFFATNFGLVGAAFGLLVGQALPMLIIVCSVLKLKGWKDISSEVRFASITCLACLPLMLNLWTGAITLIALLFLVYSRGKKYIS